MTCFALPGNCDGFKAIGDRFSDATAPPAVLAVALPNIPARPSAPIPVPHRLKNSRRVAGNENRFLTSKLTSIRILAKRPNSLSQAEPILTGGEPNGTP